MQVSFTITKMEVHKSHAMKRHNQTRWDRFFHSYLFRSLLSGFMVLDGSRLHLPRLLVVSVADEDVEGVAGRPQGVDSLLVSGTEEGLTVDLDDALSDFQPVNDCTSRDTLSRRLILVKTNSLILPVCHGPFVDLGDEDALVGIVVGIAGLAVEAALDDHAEFLVALLDEDLLEDEKKGKIQLR